MTQGLGIDISKASFDVCLLSEGKTHSQKFENTPAGFKKLIHWMKKHAADQVHACMEATGQYGEDLAEFLYQQGFLISVINPARIKAYANSKLRRNKTDKANAELIAWFCLREQPSLWSPPPISFKGLQALVRHYEDLQTTCQQEKNRLKSGGTHPLVVKDLKAHVAYLEECIHHTQQAIREHIQAYPELQKQQDLLLSIPDIGEITACKLLGEIRDIGAFEDARQLAAYAGVTPRNFTSGSSVHKKIAHVKNRKCSFA